MTSATNSGAAFGEVAWQVEGRVLHPESRGLVMGIVNVTPDSFSDGGRFADVERAVAHGLELAMQGADILDIGGESTRPGAALVPADEELARVVPVLESLRAKTDRLLSIDTSKAEVAAAACAAGAVIINDVAGFRDPEMIDVAAETGVAVVAMHMKGDPGTMQKNPHYENDDVVEAVGSFLEDRMQTLTKRGVAPERVVLDPGFGFGKTLEHNLDLARRLGELRTRWNRPVLVGVSRKSMISMLLGDDRLDARSAPTTALTSSLREQGASVFRVHEVQQSVEALRMTEAILGNNDCDT